MSSYTEDAWQGLKQFTNARIAIGRAGESLPTCEHLKFQFDHALARDAVKRQINKEELGQELKQLGYPPVFAKSCAETRSEFLQRPDKGRRLHPSWEYQTTTKVDIAVVIGDGLSATAVHTNISPLLKELIPALENKSYSISSPVIAEQARVALGDEIAERLEATMVLMLVGERPGLKSPDSLGMYLTYAPKVGTKDSERNCISNIRPDGLSYDAAVHTALYLIDTAFKIKKTGVELKDESQTIDHDDNRQSQFVSFLMSDD